MNVATKVFTSIFCLVFVVSFLFMGIKEYIIGITILYSPNLRNNMLEMDKTNG